VYLGTLRMLKKMLQPTLRSCAGHGGNEQQAVPRGASASTASSSAAADFGKDDRSDVAIRP
jgi:hypothetical protein